jgi:serine/threonine-protein kinase
MSSCTLTDQLLNDRYKIIRPLGKGGMGQTYLAEDTRRPGNPQCVVKQLKPASTDPKFLVTAKRLFNDEAVILEKLGRANDQIPQLLERFEKDEEFYMIQDFVDGHPLSSEMPLGERWSKAQVIQLLQEVLTVLDAVHQAGVIHRDIKPDNLIRRQDGKLCLIDFGAVKQIRTYQAANSQLISMSVAIGTPGYMPTEQAKGRPRPNSDLYALGMVAIQALTGMLPSQLREDDNGEVIWRDQAEVNEGLATFLDKMVRYHFKERFETAAEALQALHESTTEKSTQTASNSQQSAKHPYQPTVESEPARKPESRKPEPAAQSEVWEKVEEEVPIPKNASAEKVSPKAASMPQQNTAKSLDTVSKRERILLVIGAVFATMGLVTGVVYVQDRMQQEKTLKTADKSLADKKFDECLAQTGSFPSRHTDLYTQSQRLFESCKAGKTQQSTLQDIQNLKADGQYEKAISQAQAFSDTQSVFYPEVQKVLSESQLALARELAGKNSFKAAIDTLTKIAPNSSVQSEVQKLTFEWSEKMFNIAEKLYQTGTKPTDGKEAISIAKAIPQGSPAYNRAQAKVREWETAEAQNPNDAALINQALDGGRCQEAREAVARLTNSPAQIWRNVALSKSAQIAQCERKAATPVDEEGKLAKGELAVATRADNNTLFKDFEFAGKSGEAVTIGLRGDFDTKLYLIPPDNQEIEISDDINARNLNSSITKTLNQTGTYRVRVNAYYPVNHPKGSGSYHLTVHRETK